MPPMTPANDLIQRLHAVISTGAQHEIRLNALLSEVEKCVRKWAADQPPPPPAGVDAAPPTAPYVPCPSRETVCRECWHTMALHRPVIGCTASWPDCNCPETPAEPRS